MHAWKTCESIMDQVKISGVLYHSLIWERRKFTRKNVKKQIQWTSENKERKCEIMLGRMHSSIVCYIQTDCFAVNMKTKTINDWFAYEYNVSLFKKYYQFQITDLCEQ